MTAAAVRLSCERCRRRKTRCDKGTPCSNCNDAGISCTGIERARLPRGPSGKVKNKNMVLATRVARLENILRQLDGELETSSEADEPSAVDEVHEAPQHQLVSDADKINQLYAKNIWLTLSQEVTGLRETLEASDEEDAAMDAIPEKSDDRSGYGTISTSILFNLPSSSPDKTIESPTPFIRSALLRLYQERVDCLFKITHWPTVVTIIEKQYGPAQYQSSPSTRALEYSIYFLAICSINDEESQDMFLERRQSLLQRYRIAAEMLLSNANLLSRPDLTLLQAFVIYLKGIHSCGQRAATWTLLATAVRTASALGLPVNEEEELSAYDLEIRRRIWFCISILDFQTAADRGFMPLVALEEDTSKTPLLTNDSELLSPAIQESIPQPDTDMALVYVYREVWDCMRKLFTSPHTDNWQDKLHTVAAFRECMEQHSALIHDPTNPFRLCAQFSTKAIALDMELFLRRPPFRVKHSTSPPPWDDFDILEKTTEIMELNLTKPVNTTFAPWAWYAKPWARWYILAVLLAELCGPREGELVDKAYRIAKESFAKYGELIADTDLRDLWRPLVKLMRHVDRLRGTEPQASGTATSGISPERGLQESLNSTTQPIDQPIYKSKVVLSFDPKARQKVMDWASTKEKPVSNPGNTELWQESLNDWQSASARSLQNENSPSRIWNSFLDDIGGNRCFM
jgi:hypothetical protein